MEESDRKGWRHQSRSSTLPVEGEAASARGVRGQRRLATLQGVELICYMAEPCAASRRKRESRSTSTDRFVSQASLISLTSPTARAPVLRRCCGGSTTRACRATGDRTASVQRGQHSRGTCRQYADERDSPTASPRRRWPPSCAVGLPAAGERYRWPGCGHEAGGPVFRDGDAGCAGGTAM
jgi:hypothetical protein